jgi:three-Cys-motif partner protein
LKAKPLKFDKIGIWSELKLDIVERYGAAYTRAFNNSPGLKKFYIDAFSGAGEHISKASGQRVEGSPSRALRITPPFDHFYFIDLEAKKTANLEKRYGGNPKVTIRTGDATKLLTQEILPQIKYEKFNRALCLLDPYGLDLDWRVIEMAGRSRAVDIFLNFPVMDMNRNAIWREHARVPAEGIERMNRFWGDESWKKVAYKDHPQFQLFSPPDKVKQDNETIVGAFGERLKKDAGFSYVAAPLPMKNSKKAVVYYLMLASPKIVAKNIIEDIFRKHR